MTTVDESVDPTPIIELLAGFRAAKFLMAGTELGVFEALAGRPSTLDTLAERLGLARRTTRICADALVAIGMLERDGDTYRNSAPSAAYLAGAGPDLRPFVRYCEQVSYPAWTGFVHALRHGPSARITALDPARQQVFSAGVEALNSGPATAFAASSHLAGRHRLLDIGGGTGSWSVAAVRAQPRLRATVFELPRVTRLARQRIASEGLEDRIAVAAGDLTTDEPPGGHDCCLLANVVHCFGVADNRRVLAATRRAVEPGARLLLADYWTDPTHTEPVLAALMAGEYAVHSDQGDVYSVAEARSWLAGTGWRFVDHEPLADAKSLIVAEAV